jgi:AcrR family transcriptional regulator
MNTRERILDIALRLFNEAGTDAVSTNHIAAALGISPGNLYYHFSNKEEIIRAIFERLFATWDTDLTLPSHRAPVLDDVQRLVHDNFKIMWKYRFVYRELAALLRRDPKLRSHYEAVRQRGFSDFRQLFAEFVTAGVLAPPDGPDEVTRLAELCWLISEFWLPSVEVSGQAVDSEAMRHGVELMMQVLRPYILTDSGF